MLLSYLQRVPEFSALPPSELNALARQTAVVCVPANRQLIAAGHPVEDHLYLLRGTLQTARRRLRPPRFGAVRHFYPGLTEARTYTACEIARVPPGLYEFACARQRGAHAVDSLDAAWLKRFLSSHMMRRLSSVEWQRLVRSFARERYARGEAVIVAGRPADCCYVVEAGHAVVHHCGTTLCHLSPGDFFGEDALLLDAPRNATVTALAPLTVQKIARDVFQAVLADSLIEYLPLRGDGTCLEVGALRGCDLRTALTELSPRRQYYVVGGSRAERGLLTFLLVQRGLRAAAVA